MRPKHKIIAIQSDADEAAILRFTLATHRYAIRTAEDCRRGIGEISRFHPDAVIVFAAAKMIGPLCQAAHAHEAKVVFVGDAAPEAADYRLDRRARTDVILGMLAAACQKKRGPKKAVQSERDAAAKRRTA